MTRRAVRDRGEISRRAFLRLGLAASASLGLKGSWLQRLAPAFPDSERLGRVNVGKVEVKSRPDVNALTVKTLYEDAVVVWLRERTGSNPMRMNQRWVETDDGYIWAPYLQPVRNVSNTPAETLPATSIGAGMWAEVTVPWIDLVLDNPPPRSPWLRNTESPRLYYSQILWIDQVKKDDQGQSWYRVNEKYGYGDLLWGRGDAFRPLTLDDLSPISPGAEDKRIVVDVSYQTLACFEGKREVYFARISSGAKFDAAGNAIDKWSTPLGAHPIWRKAVSMHMTGGTTGGGYDLPGIGWTTLFTGGGVAIHSTFWHNNFGEPMSHGCVNARPDDAKWAFRWSLPRVDPIPGDVTVSMPGGTIVEVVES